MRTRHVVGLDTGPRRCGWARIAMDGSRARFVEGGEVASEVADVRRLLERTRPDLLALECPSGYVHEAFRAPGLLATARVTGGIAWLASMSGITSTELPATAVRKVLCGKATAKDGDVRDALARLGVLPMRSNVHVRDAIALAIVAGWGRAGG